MNVIEYVKQKHSGQTRKQGTPYYLHPVAVSKILKDKGFDTEYQISGLFHDLLEDTDTTFREIKNISNRRIAVAVLLVTKEPDYIKESYYRRIKKNDMARMVKLADRVHNLSEAHLADRDFQKKYIEETEKWFIDLAKGTVFEEDIARELKALKETYENSKVYEKIKINRETEFNDTVESEKDVVIETGEEIEF